MSAIAGLSAQPSYTQKVETPPPQPTARPTDSDGDHDAARPDAVPAKGGLLRLTA